MAIKKSGQGLEEKQNKAWAAAPFSRHMRQRCVPMAHGPVSCLSFSNSWFLIPIIDSKTFVGIFALYGINCKRR